MKDKIINSNLQDDQETEAEAEAEAVDTLSLTDFPIAQDHQNPLSSPSSSSSSSSAAEDFFEFFRGGLTDYSEEKMMSHAEDIIICGKLVPINEQQRRHKHPPQHREKPRNQQNQSNLPIGCRRSRSDSMSNVKTITTSPLVRNSRSLDYKKLNRNSIMCSEPATEISRDGSRKKSSSSRWYVLLFGLVKVPPSEVDLQDMKNRHVRRTSSKLSDVIPVNQSVSVDHRNCSWRVLGYLSCKSYSSVAVTTPLRYMPKV